MCDRVVHRRSFEYGSTILKFYTATDVFKVINVSTFNDFVTIWYETLENPIHRGEVTIQLVFDDGRVPNSGVYVGSTMYKGYMLHAYQLVV